MSALTDEFFEEGFWTVKQAAAFLCVCPATIYNLKDRGLLKFTKVGNATRFPKRAVLDYAKANTQGGWNL